MTHDTRQRTQATLNMIFIFIIFFRGGRGFFYGATIQTNWESEYILYAGFLVQIYEQTQQKTTDIHLQKCNIVITKEI